MADSHLHGFDGGNGMAHQAQATEELRVHLQRRFPNEPRWAPAPPPSPAPWELIRAVLT